MVNKFVVRNKNRPEMQKTITHHQEKKTREETNQKKFVQPQKMHEHIAQIWKVDYVDVFWCLYTSETNLLP